MKKEFSYDHLLKQVQPALEVIVDALDEAQKGVQENITQVPEQYRTELLRINEKSKKAMATLDPELINECQAEMMALNQRMKSEGNL